MKRSRLANNMADELEQVVRNWLFFGAIAIALFAVVRWGLDQLGLHVPLWRMFWCWYAIGIACALYWPVRAWKEMRGHLRSHLPETVLLGLFGPLAFVMGYPI